MWRCFCFLKWVFAVYTLPRLTHNPASASYNSNTTIRTYWQIFLITSFYSSLFNTHFKFERWTFNFIVLIYNEGVSKVLEKHDQRHSSWLLTVIPWWELLKITTSLTAEQRLIQMLIPWWLIECWKILCRLMRNRRHQWSSLSLGSAC